MSARVVPTVTTVHGAGKLTSAVVIVRHPVNFPGEVHVTVAEGLSKLAAMSLAGELRGALADAFHAGREEAS